MSLSTASWSRRAAAGTLILVGVALGLGLSASLRDGRPARTPSSHAAVESAMDTPVSGIPASLSRVPNPSRDGLETPFTRVADRSVPAVVSVEVVQRLSSEDDRNMMRRLFGNRADDDEEIELPSSGTGFIIDPSGLVLTNDHVVSGVTQVELLLADGRYFEAELVGADPGTDVAVLRIKDPEPGLPWLPLGNSDDVRVGDWAIAVGNPLGELAATVTVGVVSAVGRHDLRIAGGGPMYQDFVQTDASINFGNSGGPLLNVRGEVMAMNSAINPTGQGIGFAIPINMVREVAQELIRTGTVRRGYLGILPTEITRDLRDELELGDSQGILVGNVETGTPAELAGLRQSDVILSFNGQDITDVPQFRAVVAQTPVDRDVPITYLRRGREVEATVRLVERPDTPEPPTTWTQPEGDLGWLGADIQEVNPRWIVRYDLAVEEGFLVTAVRPATPADRSGLLPGDVLLEINGEHVNSGRNLERALKRARDRGRRLHLVVQRGQETRSLEIQPG